MLKPCMLNLILKKKISNYNYVCLILIIFNVVFRDLKGICLNKINFLICFSKKEHLNVFKVLVVFFFQITSVG